MQDPLLGLQLGNYRLESVIGRGGMATVYYAWDASLQRPVALKLIDARHRDNPIYAQRFIQEARVVATWRHENIIQVFYAGHEEGLYYFAMEYVDGADLGKIMRQYAAAGELMPHADALRIGDAIADALDYAHERQVIHRDVKPSNIIIARDGRIALTDFGLALHITQGTSGDSFGSPHYIAPEQARSSALTVPQSDLYAFGVLLYEILTGSLPFEDPQPAALALQHITQPPPPPRQLNPALNLDVEAVLLKALAKTPEARYKSGAGLMTALREALSQPAAANLSANALPPLPAGRMIAPRPLSEQSVAERVSLFLPPPPPDSPTLVSAPEEEAPPDSRPLERESHLPRPRWLWPLTAVILCFFLTAAVWAGWTRLAAGDNDSPPSTPLPLLDTPLSPTQSLPAPPTVLHTPAVSPTAVGGLSGLASEAEEATAEPLVETVVVVITATPAPSMTPTPGPSPTPTTLFPDGRRLELWYNEDSFYVHNPGELRVQITFMSFEALDRTGQPLSLQFDGWRWAQYYQFLEQDGCVRLEIMQGNRYIRPPLCQTYNSSVTPTDESPEVFWRLRDGVAEFRVLWRQEEVGRCSAANSFCEIYIP